MICSPMMAERSLFCCRASSGVDDEIARIEIMMSMSTIIQMILSPWNLSMNPSMPVFFFAMVFTGYGRLP